MDEALALETLSSAGRDQQVDDALLDHARTNASLDVLATAVFEDHRVDALEVQEMAEHEPGRPGADDAYLRARAAQPFEVSSNTRWAMAKAPLAAGTPQ